MPVDSKLSLIARCLLLKGQRTCTEDDGTDEWNVCSAAYDTYFEAMLEDGEFKFSTSIADLERSGDSPDADFEDAYDLPTGCLHIITVKLPMTDQTTTSDVVKPVPVPYRIVGNQILLTDGDAVPTAKFVVEPDAADLSAMFKTALQEAVNSGIESGLKKDQGTADRHLAKADAMLQRARTRGDQQEPKKALFKTRHRTARQFRRG